MAEKPGGVGELDPPVFAFAADTGYRATDHGIANGLGRDLGKDDVVTEDFRFDDLLPYQHAAHHAAYRFDFRQFGHGFNYGGVRWLNAALPDPPRANASGNAGGADGGR